MTSTTVYPFHAAVPATTPATSPASPETRPREIRDTQLPAPRQPAVETVEQLLERPRLDIEAVHLQMLSAEDDVLNAAAFGLRAAGRLVEEAVATLGQPSPDPKARAQKLLLLGTQIAQMAETTSAHSTFPLLSAGTTSYPHVEIPTFTLFGTDEHALITADPFMPSTDPQHAVGLLQRSLEKLDVASAQVLAARGQLDEARVTMATAQLEQHPPDDVPPAIPVNLTLAEHFPVDPVRAVELLTPPITGR